MGSSLRISFLSTFLSVLFTGHTFEVRTVVILGIVIDVIDFLPFTALHLSRRSFPHLILVFVLTTVGFEVLLTSCVLFLPVTLCCHITSSGPVQGLQ
jgi:hypothetical protein